MRLLRRPLAGGGGRAARSPATTGDQPRVEPAAARSNRSCPRDVSYTAADFATGCFGGVRYAFVVPERRKYFLWHLSYPNVERFHSQLHRRVTGDQRKRASGELAQLEAGVKDLFIGVGGSRAGAGLHQHLKGDICSELSRLARPFHDVLELGQDGPSALRKIIAPRILLRIELLYDPERQNDPYLLRAHDLRPRNVR